MIAKANQTPWIRRALVTILGLAAFAAVIYGLVRRRKPLPVSNPEPPVQFRHSERGLSDAEAAARLTDERIQARLLSRKKARFARIRKNVISIFNLALLVLAVSMLLLKDIWGALGALAALGFSVGINILQETRSARRVGELMDEVRPMATVIRAGNLKSIDLDFVVVGDVLVAGRGDEILADGVLLESNNFTIDEVSLEGQSRVVAKEIGESLREGTNCVSGWGLYRVERIILETAGDENPIAEDSTAQDITPLQKIVQRVLYVLMAITGVFYISLVLEVVRADFIPPDVLTMYKDVMYIIFNLTPGGLLFMVLVNYAQGSAEIARTGVLVRNSRSIEALAQISTFCLIKRGGLTGLTVITEMIPSASGEAVVSDSRARQALGNYVHSIQDDRFPLPILREALEGEKRAIDQQVPYLSIYGWEALTFTSIDMPGSYVIGYPDALNPYLQASKPAHKGKDKRAAGKDKPVTEKNGQGSKRRSLLKWLRRGKQDSQPAVAESHPNEAVLASTDPAAPSDPGLDAAEKPKKLSLLRRVSTRVVRLVRPRHGEKDQDEKQTDVDHPDEVFRLIFAYSPSQQLVYDADNQPQCPRDLVPVCFLRFVEEARPETKEIARQVIDAGVSIKILSDDHPIHLLGLAQQAGIVDDQSIEIPYAVGEELAQLTPDQIRDAAREKTVFAQMTSNQIVQILAALREQGKIVAVRGSSIADLRIFRQANLSITNQGSSPSVLEQADIILLKNSHEAIAKATRIGQRIVNGVLDVLRLNLTPIFYILILLVIMYVMGERTFFYNSAQGSAINILTVIFPGIGLSFWSLTVAVDPTRMHKQIVHFFVPAGVTITIFVVILFTVSNSIFFDITHSQLLVSHMLVIIGLFMVIFVQPPVRFLASGAAYSGDWRHTILAGSLYLFFLVAIRVPLAQSVFKIVPLASMQEYLVVWGMALGWALVIQGVWRISLLNRGLNWSAKWMVESDQ